jgi:hypothetical protein
VLSGPLPGSYDTVVVRALLQVLSPENARLALRNIAAAINPAGTIYVVAQILDDSRISPPEAVGFNLSLISQFDSGESYTEQEHRGWLSEAGFVDIERANFLLPDERGEMRSTPMLLWLYLLNAAVLFTHEIDSAYWHEWELFGLPGGIQVFLCVNLLLIIVILYGHQALAVGRVSGLCSLVGAGRRRAFRGRHPHLLSAPRRWGFPTPGVSRASRHHVLSIASTDSDALEGAERSAMTGPPEPLLQGTRRKRRASEQACWPCD